MTGRRIWDLAVVGAGPAGAAAALGALDARPDLSVALIDRADFPRDKACGDGIAPHVLDLLAEVGLRGLLDDRSAASGLSVQDDPREPARSYREAVRSLLAGHLRHTALTARLAGSGWVVGPGIDAAASRQRVFDDLVELGLGRGRLTPAVLGGLLASVPGEVTHARDRRG